MRSPEPACRRRSARLSRGAEASAHPHNCRRLLPVLRRERPASSTSATAAGGRVHGRTLPTHSPRNICRPAEANAEHVQSHSVVLGSSLSGCRVSSFQSNAPAVNACIVHGNFACRRSSHPQLHSRSTSEHRSWHCPRTHHAASARGTAQQRARRLSSDACRPRAADEHHQAPRERVGRTCSLRCELRTPPAGAQHCSSCTGGAPLKRQ